MGSPKSPDSDPKSTWFQIGKAIRDINDLKHQRGDIASLRRIVPKAPDSPIFWKLAINNFAQGELVARIDQDLPRWAAFLQALAQLTDLILTEPSARPSFGSALALAKFSEPRLLRLFRAQETLFDEVRVAAHQIDQRGIALNPFDLGLLLLETRPTQAAKVRRRIAHNYYRQLYHTHSNNS